ncbi:acetyl-CoA carboxylase, carboxyltransferase subunit beta [Opitutales bacterium ASA1]|uniref:acetyl-CoA carboxylase, carboxyltransferase subunit beta n=1 Tax=Congregicoccus parvus TaxID=3081749 RepID=UPI002B31055E|nr:acetyl-CoA carboxylase, carboxyltransferase subunit beta [Opitutales bacterium ASA1]
MSLFSKPKYSTVTVKKKDIPLGLWKKCPKSGEIVYIKELEENQYVVPKSGFHFPISSTDRIRHLVDADSFVEHDKTLRAVDALEFVDSAPYADRLAKYRRESGIDDAVVCGMARIHRIPVSLAVMDFRFAGGSMGSVVGEKITRAIERAREKETPCIVFSASGGARMQEGILSLMQMAKTSAALARLSAARLPFISVLTNPTTGGVTASFAVLGDVILAEPGALVGFAGPRVVRETTQQTLPEGFQSAEFLLKHGLVDQIVSRLDMRDRIADILQALFVRKARGTVASA